jgi:hypothetical protein
LYTGSASLKTSPLQGVFLVRKRVQAHKVVKESRKEKPRLGEIKKGKGE